MTSAMDLIPQHVRDTIAAPVAPSHFREDLRCVPAAEAAGWRVAFRNGHWHNSATFTRNGVSVWWAGTWRRMADGAPYPAVKPELFKTCAAALGLPEETAP